MMNDTITVFELRNLLTVTSMAAKLPLRDYSYRANRNMEVIEITDGATISGNGPEFMCHILWTQCDEQGDYFELRWYDDEKYRSRRCNVAEETAELLLEYFPERLKTLWFGYSSMEQYIKGE